MNTRMFFEAALELAKSQGQGKCECGGVLHLVWIGSDEQPKKTIQYISCLRCEAEYVLALKFIKGKEIPVGR